MSSLPTAEDLRLNTTLAQPPPAVFQNTVEGVEDEDEDEDEDTVLERLGDGITSMYESMRFNLGLPPDNTPWHLLSSKSQRRMRAFEEQRQRSMKLGDVYESKPEQIDNYEPASIFSRRELKAGHGPACGVGITFCFDEEQDSLVVTRLVEGGPAARAGTVEIGDVLVEVDGIVVCSQPLDVVHSIIRGQEGSACRMLFTRLEEGGLCDVPVTLVRERLPEISEYMAPKRAGVGITFETEAIDGSACVKALVRGSDADTCGLIQRGDILYEVDRTNVFREPLDVIANLILGEPNTKVRILLLRGTRIFIEVVLTRTPATRMSDMASILLHAQNAKRIVTARHTQQVKEGEEDLSGMFQEAELGMAGGGDSMMALKAIERQRKLPQGVTKSSSYKSIQSLMSQKSVASQKSARSHA